MGQIIWPAIIGAIAAILVALIQFVVAPLVTQGQLQEVKSELQEEIKLVAPNWKIFPVKRTDQDVEEVLDGEWDVCMLTTIGTIHHNQACTCGVKPNGRKWTFIIDLDQTVRGSFCRCQASCVDFPKQT